MSSVRRDSVAYTVGFAALVCLVCAIPIAVAAVALKPRQQTNQRVDRLQNVLMVAGVMDDNEKLSADDVLARFAEYVVPRAVELSTGRYVDSIDVEAYDQRSAAKDPVQSREAPTNAAKVLRVPNHAVVFEIVRDNAVSLLVLPIQGYGLWSTMYGYLALEPDARTVASIIFYEHGETPGLGGEIQNPRWQSRWRGRQVYADDGRVALEVIKGSAGPPDTDPYRVDGLSGATITARGVSATIAFWLGPDAFGPYLAQYRPSPPPRMQ